MELIVQSAHNRHCDCSVNEKISCTRGHTHISRVSLEKSLQYKQNLAYVRVKFVERCIVSNEDNVFELQGLRRQKGGPRQEAHERVYGVGPGGEAKTGRSVPPASQRRAVENTGKVMAVSVARSLCLRQYFEPSGGNGSV